MHTVFSRLAVVGLALTAVLPASAIAQEWPMNRHDSTRTGSQSAGADIRTPGILARISLGGAVSGSQWLVGDADTDGTDEVYLVSGGRLMCWRGDGTLRWATDPMALSTVLALTDFDGDGRVELFATGTQIPPLAVDALTGDILWRASLPEGAFVGDVFPLDADGDGSLELVVSEWGGARGGEGTAHIFAFPDGLSGAVSDTRLDTGSHAYWFGRGLAVADLAGDGRPSLIAPSADRVVAYDPESGNPRWTSADLGDFPHGRAQVNAADVDGDGRQELIVASNNAGATWPAAKRLLLLELLFLQNNVARLLPDRPPFVVSSFLDPSRHVWSTLVIDGASESGTPTFTLEGQAAVALSDVDDDGIQEIVTIDTSGELVPEFGTLRALRLTGSGAPSEVWVEHDSRLLTTPDAWHRGVRLGRTSRGVLVGVDRDGDRRAERLEYANGDGTAYSLSGGVFAVDSMPPSGPPTDHIWVSRTDGGIARLDGNLRLTNPAAGTRTPALVVGAYLAAPPVTTMGASGMMLAAVDATRAPVVYQSSSDVEILWRSAATVDGASLIWLPGDAPRLAFVASESNGTLALVVLDGHTGAELRRISLSDSVSTTLVNDLLPLRDDAGKLIGVMAGVLDQRSGVVNYTLLDPDDGTSISMDLGRSVFSGEYPGTAHDVDGDGTEDALIVQASTLRVVSGTTGARILEHRNPRNGGMMSYVDLDADGVVDVLHQGGFGRFPGKGARRLTHDMSGEVWAVEQEFFHNSAALARTREGGYRIGLTRSRKPWFGVVDSAGAFLGQAVPAGGLFYSDEMAAEDASAQLGVPTSAAGLAPTTDARSAIFVFGATDGFLYGANAEDASLAWSLPLRASVGEPIASDLIGDAQSEVVVPAGDGSIYIVGPAELASPTDVFDNDGVTLAESEADDIDRLANSSMVGANWPSVSGATGYEHELVRDDDLVVRPWTDVGNATHVTLTGLSLEPGRRYLSLVRAYDRSGDVRVSPEIASDGFTVVDEEGPTVSLTATPDVIWLDRTDRPTSTGIVFTARDNIGLQSYSIHVENAGGMTLTTLASGPASGLSRTIEATWSGTDDGGGTLEPGQYVVVGRATDTDDRTTEARTSVTVCDEGSPDLARCGAAGPDAGTHPEGPWQVSGGGCNCGIAGMHSSGSAVSLAAVAFLAWMRRKRKSRRYRSVRSAYASPKKRL